MLRRPGRGFFNRVRSVGTASSLFRSLTGIVAGFALLDALPGLMRLFFRGVVALDSSTPSESGPGSKHSAAYILNCRGATTRCFPG